MEISSYRFGSIVIDGKTYTKDLKIIKDRIIENWWRKDGHFCTLDDISDIIDASPHTLILGTGASGLMKPAAGLSEKLGEYGIRLESIPTELAAMRYNELCNMVGSDQVAFAAHLTC